MAALAGARPAAGLWLVLLAGCSASNAPDKPAGPTVADDMVEVARLLQDYTSEFGRGPNKLADLARDRLGYPRGYSAIESGQVVVTWGVKVGADENAPPGGVVAYEKKAPTGGGSVLFENGEIKAMSAADFQAAPRAKKGR